MMVGLRHAPKHEAAYRDGFEPIRGTGPGIDKGLLATEAADRNMRRALFRYGSRYGLPNMSKFQCIEELRLLDLVYGEDQALAGKIEAEMNRKALRDTA